MHILLIEPDSLQARLYGSALAREGHSVAYSSTAQSAVHAADEQVPDIVILELQLPGHNGIEFLYEFRSYPEWMHVPVVIHTFVPVHELAQADVLKTELGVQRILYKPSTVLATLQEAVLQAAR
jgi:DNA-binding response OmpR family regulator